MTLKNRGPATHDVNLALCHVSRQRISVQRPRKVTSDPHFNVVGPIPEVPELLELWRQVMISVVGPAAIKASALADGEAVPGVERVERCEVTSFSSCEERGDDGLGARGVRAGSGRRGGRRRRSGMLMPLGLEFRWQGRDGAGESEREWRNRATER